MHFGMLICAILIIPSLVLCSPVKNGYIEAGAPKVTNLTGVINSILSLGYCRIAELVWQKLYSKFATEIS